MRLKYTVIKYSGFKLGNDLEPDKIEAVMASDGKRESSRFIIKAQLPSNISAFVSREGEMKDVEYVEVKIGKKQIKVRRKGKLIPSGELSVSCDPNGERAPVRAINIEFRDYKDGFTDRGTVWVEPGEPSWMYFVLHGEVLGQPGLVETITKEAESAVENQLLSRFA